MERLCLLGLLLGLIFTALTSCDGVQKKGNSIDMKGEANDSIESIRDGISEVKNNKTKMEIIEERIGPGWEGVGRVNASPAVQVNGKLTFFGSVNSHSLYLYAKSIGNNIVYQATSKKIEDWDDAENDLGLVTKGDYSVYDDNRGEVYHFNATVDCWYFNLP